VHGTTSLYKESATDGTGGVRAICRNCRQVRSTFVVDLLLEETVAGLSSRGTCHVALTTALHRQLGPSATSLGRPSSLPPRRRRRRHRLAVPPTSAARPCSRRRPTTAASTCSRFPKWSSSSGTAIMTTTLVVRAMSTPR